jgi:hypothetical protein
LAELWCCDILAQLINAKADEINLHNIGNRAFITTTIAASSQIPNPISQFSPAKYTLTIFTISNPSQIHPQYLNILNNLD